MKFIKYVLITLFTIFCITILGAVFIFSFHKDETSNEWYQAEQTNKQYDTQASTIELDTSEQINTESLTSAPEGIIFEKADLFLDLFEPEKIGEMEAAIGRYLEEHNFVATKVIFKKDYISDEEDTSITINATAKGVEDLELTIIYSIKYGNFIIS